VVLHARRIGRVESVSAGDLIVVHLNPVGAAGTAPGSETTGKNQYANASYAANYDTACRIRDPLHCTEDRRPRSAFHVSFSLRSGAALTLARADLRTPVPRRL